MAADSRVAEAVSRGREGVGGRSCWPITVIAATNRPTTAINTRSEKHGVTNVSLSYDYLARLVAGRIVRCGLQTELDTVCVTFYASLRPHLLRVFAFSSRAGPYFPPFLCESFLQPISDYYLVVDR